ncbi:MAG: hypothetical protein JW895_10175 [Thermoleophilaceae bacterium]|nr:hypothetical protein [Thermoleophilaceae bacterium]
MIVATSVLVGLAVGAGVGLVASFVLVPILLRSTRPRAVSPTHVYRTTGIPTTSMDGLDDRNAVALLRRWQALSARPSGHIALVAADEKLQPLVHDATRRLAALRVPDRRRNDGLTSGGGDDTAVLPALLPGEGAPTVVAAEPALAQRSDVLVLMVRSNMSIDDLVAAVRELGDAGHRPNWILLVDSLKKTRQLLAATDGSAGSPAS